MPTNRSWQPGFEPTTWRRSRLSSATTSTTSSAWRTGEVNLCRRCLWNQMFLDVVVSPNNNLWLSCWVWWLTESDELELAQAQHLCCLYLNITVLMVCKLQCFSSTSLYFQSFDPSSLHQNQYFSLFFLSFVCQDQLPLRTYLVPTSALPQVILQQVRSIEAYCPFWVERENETLLKLCGAWTLQQCPCTMCNYFEIGRTMETWALCWK